MKTRSQSQQPCVNSKCGPQTMLSPGHRILTSTPQDRGIVSLSPRRILRVRVIHLPTSLHVSSGHSSNCSSGTSRFLTTVWHCRACCSVFQGSLLHRRAWEPHSAVITSRLSGLARGGPDSRNRVRAEEALPSSRLVPPFPPPQAGLPPR